MITTRDGADSQKRVMRVMRCCKNHAAGPTRNGGRVRSMQIWDPNRRAFTLGQDLNFKFYRTPISD